MEQNSDHINNYVTVEVPIELLFCEPDVFATEEYRQIENITRKWIEHHFRYSGISIARLTPHINLFESFIENKNLIPAKYLEWYSNLYTMRNFQPPLSPTDILMKRQKEYTFMKNELDNKSDFFKNIPPIVRYNNGLFNIKDGHHRAVFQLCNGIRRIFVRMNMADYKAWLNEEQEKNVTKIIQSQSRKLFYTPILHPAFYDITVERDTGHPTRLELILRYLGPRNLRGQSVIDIGCNIGYYARHFAREGAVVTGIEPDACHSELLEAVNKLENVNFEVIKECFEECTLPTYNIGILLTVFYHMMGNEKIREAFLKQIDGCILDMFFWESGDQIETEKKMILENTSFVTYEKLGSTYGTGKTRELGVFLNRCAK